MAAFHWKIIMTQGNKLSPPKFSGKELRMLRKEKHLNQSEFWNAINVTQSGGSRYERGREIPDQVAIMIELVHIHGIDLSTKKARKQLKAV